jgi:hypothetical protein
MGYSLWNSLYTTLCNNKWNFLLLETKNECNGTSMRSIYFVVSSFFLCVCVCVCACVRVREVLYFNRISTEGSSKQTGKHWTYHEHSAKRNAKGGGGGKRNGKTNRDTHKRRYGSEEGLFCIIFVEARMISVSNWARKCNLNVHTKTDRHPVYSSLSWSH